MSSCGLEISSGLARLIFPSLSVALGKPLDDGLPLAFSLRGFADMGLQRRVGGSTSVSFSATSDDSHSRLSVRFDLGLDDAHTHSKVPKAQHRSEEVTL